MADVVNRAQINNGTLPGFKGALEVRAERVMRVGILEVGTEMTACMRTPNVDHYDHGGYQEEV